MTIDRRRYAAAVHAHRNLAADWRGWLDTMVHPTAQLRAGAPVNEVASRDAWGDALFAPLARAFPDLERRTDILLHGRFVDGDWFASAGALVGRFDRDLWGIPATGRPHWLRFGWFDRVEDGAVVETILLLDLSRLLIEAGRWPLRPPLGEAWWPAPATHDGVRLEPGNATDDAASLALVEAMIAGLMRYDGHDLRSMGMTRFWSDQFLWYGPGAIGSARGHADYERAHQRPFLASFPDRVGGNHRCRIGDGPYVASTGWPSIRATHSGVGLLGLPASGTAVTMRVMDFWRREADWLVENWVFIDLPDLLGQLGVDLGLRA